MITITINGKEIKLDKPMTVLNAAKKAGIKIPTLCNHELLEPFGGCRLCVVEVERMPKLMTSCTLMAADGMVVKTESDAITRVRRVILEFLLINHPLDCPYCDKAGECELQDAVMQYGPPIGRFKEEKRKVPTSHEDPIFARNMERCIACTRCIRICAAVQGASAITMVDRGSRTVVEPFSSKSFNCEYCGNCMIACPVGSILSKRYIHSYRPWQMDKKVETICGYCGVGCSLILQIRDESIKRVWSRNGLGLNNGILCSKGTFGYEFLKDTKRLSEPLIRKDGELRKSTWDEALALVANKLMEIKKANGGSAIAGIASARCTNEDNYVFQKFMRVVCESNNIDSISRTGFAAAQKYFEKLLGQGITANTIEGIKNSDAVLVLCGDPTAVNPVLGLSVREAARRGSKVIILGHAPGLERFKVIKLTPPLFKEAEVLEALLTGIFTLKGKRSDGHVIDEEISRLSEKSSIKIDLKGFEELKEILLNSASMSIVFGMDLVQRTDGHRALFAVAGIAYLLEARLYLLSERPNEQGLIDVGCVPDMLPGGRPLNIADFRKRYEDAWRASIPEHNGLTLMEIIEGAKTKKIEAIYVMGENPVFNLPDSLSVRDALSSVDFLVVQDIFLTETAGLADVVLPALGWSEKTGTYTNLERRIQFLRKAVNPVRNSSGALDPAAEQQGIISNGVNSSSGMEDWKIISEVSDKIGYRMGYSDSGDIMKELSAVSPLYKDLSYDEIINKDNLWPYKGEPLRGEVKDIPAAVVKRCEYKADFYLSLERTLFHSGTLSQKSSLLRMICPEPTLKIGHHHAERLDLKEGDSVNISTDRGSMDVRISLDASINDNKVLLSNHFEGKGVFSLLNYSLDPITKAPGIEGCEVTIKKR